MKGVKRPESGNPGSEKAAAVAGMSAVKDKPETVSLSTLFRYAGPIDLLLIFFGTVGAGASGVLRPVSSIIFGERVAPRTTVSLFVALSRRVTVRSCSGGALRGPQRCVCFIGLGVMHAWICTRLTHVRFPHHKGNVLRDLNRSHNIVGAVTEQSIYYCYLAIAGLVLGFMQSWVRRKHHLVVVGEKSVRPSDRPSSVLADLSSQCWALVAERQAFRIRKKYLEVRRHP